LPVSFPVQIIYRIVSYRIYDSTSAFASRWGQSSDGSCEYLSRTSLSFV